MALTDISHTECTTNIINYPPWTGFPIGHSWLSRHFFLVQIRDQCVFCVVVFVFVVVDVVGSSWLSEKEEKMYSPAIHLSWDGKVFCLIWLKWNRSFSFNYSSSYVDAIVQKSDRIRFDVERAMKSLRQKLPQTENKGSRDGTDGRNCRFLWSCCTSRFQFLLVCSVIGWLHEQLL